MAQKHIPQFGWVGPVGLDWGEPLEIERAGSWVEQGYQPVIKDR